MRWLAGLVLFALVALGAAYFIAGRGTPPVLRIDKPERLVGQAGTLEVFAEAPRARLTTLTITLEQNGRTLPLFSLDGAQSANVTQVDPNRIRVSRPFGKQSVPDLQSGTARIVVAATRRSFLSLRTLSSTMSKDIQVRLEPPRIAVVSTHHYVNHGGSEMVVYRATPPDTASGVRVGEVEYPGFAASGAGVTGPDPGLKTAFFALLYDQELNAPIVAFARDEAGNEAKANFVDNVFQKPQKRSRIELDDGFVNRVVPEILAHSPELKMAAPAEGDDMLPAFLKINGELRRINSDEIAALASKTSSKKLWEGPFVQLGNSQVEASFADHRTYVRKGKEVDQQVHLGFDLAVTSNVAIVAANAGKVAQRELAGHLRQLRRHRPRHGRAVALRTLVVARREGGRHGDEGPDHRPQRHDGPRRRRPSALHDARQRASGEPGGMVGPALDSGSGRAEAQRRRRAGNRATARWRAGALSRRARARRNRLNPRPRRA